MVWQRGGAATCGLLCVHARVQRVLWLWRMLACGVLHMACRIHRGVPLPPWATVPSGGVHACVRACMHACVVRVVQLRPSNPAASGADPQSPLPGELMNSLMSLLGSCESSSSSWLMMASAPKSSTSPPCVRRVCACERASLAGAQLPARQSPLRVCCCAGGARKRRRGGWFRSSPSPPPHSRTHAP